MNDMLAHWSASPTLGTQATLTSLHLRSATTSPTVETFSAAFEQQRPQFHRRQTSSSESTLDVLRILRREWQPCTSGQRLAVFMSQEKNGPFLRSLCSQWRKLSSPRLEVIAELCEMRVIGHSNELDLAVISLQQEQTIAMFIQHALSPSDEPIVAEPFHTFAAQVGLFSMIKAELLAIENGIPAYERPALYEQVWRDLLDDFAEAKAQSCSRLDEHACLGKIVWGEAYGWPAAQLKEAYMEYATQLEQGMPPVKDGIDFGARNRAVSSSPSSSPDVASFNTPTTSSSMTSPQVSPHHADVISAAVNVEVEAEFNANLKAALQTLYSIEEANAVVEQGLFGAPAPAMSSTLSVDGIEEIAPPAPSSAVLARRPTWMNFWEQAQTGMSTTDNTRTLESPLGLSLDLNAPLDLSALVSTPLLDGHFANTSVLGTAFTPDSGEQHVDALQTDFSGHPAASDPMQTSPSALKRKMDDLVGDSVPMESNKRHLARSKVQRRLLQDVSLRMRTLTRQLNTRQPDAKLTEAMSFAMSGKSATSQWAEMQALELLSPVLSSSVTTAIDDTELKRLTKQRLRKRDLETVAKLASMANIIVETPLGKIKASMKTIYTGATATSAAQRRQEVANSRDDEQWPLSATLQAWMDFEEDWEQLIATEQRLLPTTVPNARSLETMVQLLRLAFSTGA